MREIKFRAWEFESEEMFECVSVATTSENKCISMFIKNGLIDSIKGAHELMEYTGLKDKNGVWIFEGDVIKDDTSKYKVVIFKDGTFGCKVKRLKSFYSKELIEIFYTIYEYVLSGVELEVIGNIYENKDLLEEIK